MRRDNTSGKARFFLKIISTRVGSKWRRRRTRARALSFSLFFSRSRSSESVSMDHRRGRTSRLYGRENNTEPRVRRDQPVCCAAASFCCSRPLASSLPGFAWTSVILTDLGGGRWRLPRRRFLLLFLSCSRSSALSRSSSSQCTTSATTPRARCADDVNQPDCTPA